MLMRRLKRFFFPRVFNSAHWCAIQVKPFREQLIIMLKLNHLRAYFSSFVSCLSVICRLLVGHLLVKSWLTLARQSVYGSCSSLLLPIEQGLWQVPTRTNAWKGRKNSQYCFIVNIIICSLQIRMFRSDTFNPAGRPQAIEGNTLHWKTTCSKQVIWFLFTVYSLAQE